MVASIGLGNREEQLARLRGESFDTAIVGGGITGAGIALDLAARGLRVALVERNDFASGTSSRSSKLIHGGLRYLAQLQFGVTREALRERHTLLRLAPALVEPLPFAIPVTGGALAAARIAAGLGLYDLLAGDRRLAPFAHLPLRDLALLAPGIDTAPLTTAFVYRDCRTDDALLTLSVLRQAHRRGAVLVNRVEATELRYGNGYANGLIVRDGLGEEDIEVTADRVVLATGAWGEGSLAPSGASRVRLRPSKGVHLFVSAERLPIRLALYLPTGFDDRLIFVVPWQGRILVGTTDTDYVGPLDRPRAQPADVAYLLAALNRAFPATGLSERDIVGVQAGIRPLIHAEGKASDASREERIHRRADGVIAIAGGKLTTYRRMAEKVAEALGFDVSLARGRPTEEIEVAPRRSDRALAERLCVAGVAEAGADRVARIYGQDAEAIATMVEGESALARPLVAGQAPIRAEVVFGARHGQARGVGDVLARRTRLILLDQCGARGAVGDVADLIARELGWSPAQRRRAVEEFLAEAEQFTVPAVQPV